MSLKHNVDLSIKMINAQVKHEGWSIYYCFGSLSGDFQIQRDDEKRIFTDDLHAISFVKNKAKEGSLLHCAAIGLVSVLNPIELNQIFKK